MSLIQTTLMQIIRPQRVQTFNQTFAGRWVPPQGGCDNLPHRLRTLSLLLYPNAPHGLRP